MKSRSRYIFSLRCLILLFINIYLTSCYFVTTNSVRDLERNTADFSYDAARWAALPATSSSQLYQLCSSYILGGPGVLGSSTTQTDAYFTRVYNNLPSHTMVYFSFSLWAIDNWNNAQDGFVVQVDLTSFPKWILSNGVFTQSSCGTSALDLADVKMLGRVNHNINFLTFRIISKLTQPSSNRAFGIRGLTLHFANPTPTMPSENLCGKHSNTAALGGNLCHTCADNQYRDSSGFCQACANGCARCFSNDPDKCYECASGYSYNGASCIQCASGCSACNGTASNQCTACTSGYLLNRKTCVSSCPLPLKLTEGTYCDSPCHLDQFVHDDQSCSNDCPLPYYQDTLLGTVKYCRYTCSATQTLYPDGICRSPISGCQAPMKPRTDGSRNFCDYDCNSYEYLYWNGTCGSSCDNPLTIQTQYTKKFCTYTCTVAGTALYWEKTCAACNSPLVSRTEGGKAFCDFPCPIEQYLYWNGTCSYYCSAPLSPTTAHIRKFCNYNCNPTQFLKFDGTCVNECKAPFITRIEAGYQYCDPICPVPQYLMQDGSCIETCEAPLRVRTNNTGIYCLLPCDSAEEYYYEETKECKTVCNTPPIFEKGLYWKCIPVKPIPEVVQIVKLFHYIPYLQMQLPPKLQNMEVSRGTNLMSIRMNPSVLESIPGKLPTFPLPTEFENKVPSTNFVANCLDELVILAILIVAAFISSIAKELFRRWDMPKVEVFFDVIQVLTRWNLPLMVLAVSAGDILFYAALDFRTFDSEASEAFYSIALSVLMFIAVITLYLGNFLLVMEAQALRNQTFGSRTHKKYEDFLIKWRGFQVLFQGYNEDGLLRQSFYLIYSIRMALPMIISACLTTVPLVQIPFYIVLNLFVIIFLLWKRPLTRKLYMVNLAVLEGLMLLVNASLLVLIGLDAADADKPDVRSFFGDVIVIGNFCVDLLALLFLVLKLVNAVQSANKLRQKKAYEEKAAWLQLIWIPLQQGGMGFEEAQVYLPEKGVSGPESSVPIIKVSSFPQDSAFDNSNVAKKEDGFDDLDNMSSSRIGLYPSAKKINQDGFPINRPVNKDGNYNREDSVKLSMDNTLPLEDEANFGFPIKRIAVDYTSKGVERRQDQKSEKSWSGSQEQKAESQGVEEQEEESKEVNEESESAVQREEEGRKEGDAESVEKEEGENREAEEENQEEKAEEGVGQNKFQVDLDSFFKKEKNYSEVNESKHTNKRDL